MAHCIRHVVIALAVTLATITLTAQQPAVGFGRDTAAAQLILDSGCG